MSDRCRSKMSALLLIKILSEESTLICSHNILSKVHACSSHSIRSEPSVTPMEVACQAPLSMRFPRQEYWNGLPFPPPGDLQDPGVEPKSPGSPVLAGRFFTTEPWEPHPS